MRQDEINIVSLGRYEIVKLVKYDRQYGGGGREIIFVYFLFALHSVIHNYSGKRKHFLDLFCPVFLFNFLLNMDIIKSLLTTLLADNTWEQGGTFEYGAS